MRARRQLKPSEQVAVMVTCGVGAWRAVVHALPWAAVVALVTSGLTFLVGLQFQLEVRRGRWMVATWESFFDDRGFLGAIGPRQAEVFGSSLERSRSFTLVVLVMVVVAVLWLQTLMAVAVRYTDRFWSVQTFTVFGQAVRKLPSMLLAWGVPVAALVAMGAGVGALGSTGNPWLFVPALGAFGAVLYCTIPSLLLVPAYVVESDEPIHKSWLEAIFLSVQTLQGRSDEVWFVVMTGAILAAGPVLAVALLAAAATVFAVPLSIGIATAGVALAMGALAAAGATAIDYYG